ARLRLVARHRRGASVERIRFHEADDRRDEVRHVAGVELPDDPVRGADQLVDEDAAMRGLVAAQLHQPLAELVPGPARVPTLYVKEPRRDLDQALVEIAI